MSFRATSTLRRKEAPTINLTPLIDVVFILLIFFLLTTTFRSTAGLDVDLPSASSAQTTQNENQIILTLNSAGELFLNGQKKSQSIAISELNKIKQQQKDLFIILQADQIVPHGEVVRILDELRKSGLHKIAIGTQSNPQP